MRTQKVPRWNFFPSMTVCFKMGNSDVQSDKAMGSPRTDHGKASELVETMSDSGCGGHEISKENAT
jgi:hypothetical protein